MKVIKDKDTKKLDGIAIEIIEKAYSEVLSRKRSFVMGIPGGRAVQGIFKRLGYNSKIGWKDTHIFMVDERLVGPEGKESNISLAKELFIDKLLRQKKIDPENIHPFSYSKDDIKKGLSDYKEQLKRLGSKYDLMILSSGEDSHIASLFPGHSSIVDDSPDYIWMDDSPKPPPARISVSRKMLLRSGYCIILFYGDSKTEAFKRYMDKGNDVYDCPAKLAQGIRNSYALVSS